MFQDLSRSARFRQQLCALACAAVVLVLAAPMGAQTITGNISGRVTDTSGGVLPGVTVTILNENTGLTVTRVTDENGT